MLSNPFFHALLTEHASRAIGTRSVLRYPADIIPFAALADPSPEAMRALSELLAPGETIYVTGEDLPTIREIEHVKLLPCLQYHFPPEDVPPRDSGLLVRRLTAADSAAMVALTDVAFPGYFRPHAHVLGPYYGIQLDGNPDGALIAMAGTRICLPGYREISAVCTHPAHLGRGHAAALTRHILRKNAAAGFRSFLHVLAANHRATALYERLGFIRAASILFNQLRRV